MSGSRPVARSIHPGLGKLLLATLLLAAVALWWPNAAPPQLAVQPASTAPAATPSGALSQRTAYRPLPPELQPPTFDKATFDPFVGALPPAPPPAAKPAPVVQPVVAVVVPPPPAPVAPPINYRYLGRMTEPAGQMSVYLARADAMVQVSVGALLDEGYVVEAIDGEGVRLHYPPLNMRVVIPVPPPPQDAQTR